MPEPRYRAQHRPGDRLARSGADDQADQHENPLHAFESLRFCANPSRSGRQRPAAEYIGPGPWPALTISQLRRFRRLHDAPRTRGAGFFSQGTPYALPGPDGFSQGRACSRTSQLRCRRRSVREQARSYRVAPRKPADTGLSAGEKKPGRCPAFCAAGRIRPWRVRSACGRFR